MSLDTRNDIAPADHTVRIDAGNRELDLVLVQDGTAPLRVLRFGPKGATGDLPAGRPAIEIVTVDAGRAPSTPRLIDAVASQRLRYREHRTDFGQVTKVTTVVLVDEEGLEAELRLEVVAGSAAVRCTTTVRNAGSRRRVLRSVTSVALRVGLGAHAETAPAAMELSSARSDWVGESRWRTVPLDSLLVDLRKAVHGGGEPRNGYAVTSTGTWSTAGSLPSGVLALHADPADERADREADGGAIAWQVEHNGGWRWETGEDAQGSYLALSGPLDQDHQWLQPLQPGEQFTTVPALLATGRGFDQAVAALNGGRRGLRRQHPDNGPRPVVFNDYMNTLMGDPTTEKLLPLIDQAAEAGAEIFCIDAGWYDDSGNWWFSVGDWLPSTVRFPGGGLKAVLDRIRERGMVPGLWLEPEVIGIDSPAATRLPDDAFLQRLGERIVEHGRYTLDLRHPAAVAHLDAVIDRVVDELGVGYLKLDYNIDPGAGTDVGTVSVGAGLLEHNRAHLAWLDSVLDRHPALVLENCASGAMRMDGAMLARLQLQSTSDQQDPWAYPPIAASAPLAMLPEQAANWAYPQPDMSDEAIAYTLCTAMLGRFYLSGRLDGMTKSQRMLVAEAVAAHKRLRPGIATGAASWPLGIDLWAAPWVALALGDAGEQHLTLWRRGAERTVEVPLPAFRGGPLVIETVFPRRLEPWSTAWDADRAVLIVTVPDGIDEAAARTFRIGARPFVEHASIDASARTGAVHGGATGMLYGLASSGNPAPALLSGIRPRTLAQKAPHGLQHPGGDALEVADDFFAAGGQEVLVYLQDALTEWPYEQLGIDAYVPVMEGAVREVSARPDRERFVYVPFNEGDWIWYDDWSDAGRDRFLADWATAVRAIRAIDPAARIAGPNESHYYPARVRDFLASCRDQDLLPDVMSWHELQPSSLERFAHHLQHYRGLEAELGVGPLPINIDEYANRRDTSVPGRLIQWIDLLETGKVDGDLAYWTMAGNLDDHAVGRQEANGGWWLLHWYAGLRGETVRTVVESPGVRDSLHVLAGREGDVVTALVGGGTHAVALGVAGLPAAPQWRVRVERVGWSGYEGPLAAPTPILDLLVAPHDGVVSVEVPGDDPLAAYRVVVGPDDGAGPVVVAPPLVVPAGDATGTDLTWIRHDDDWQQYAGSGRVGIAGTPQPTSRAEFAVTVAEGGATELAVHYGTDGVPASVEVVVDDGVPIAVDLPATLTRGFIGRVTVPLRLAAGAHRIAIRPRDGADIALDRIELAAAAGARRYAASTALRTGAGSAGTDVVAPASIGPGSGLAFHIGVPVRGRYRLSLDSEPGARVTIDGAEIGFDADVALAAGITEVRIDADRRVGVRSLTVEPLAAGSPVHAVTEKAWSLIGAATLHADAATAFIDGLGDGERGAGSAALPAPPAGRYLLTVQYSNADRLTGHEYNADVIDRHLAVRCDDGPVTALAFPFTHDWGNFRTASFPIDVPAGTSRIVLGPLRGPGPRVGGAALDIVSEGGGTS